MGSRGYSELEVLKISVSAPINSLRYPSSSCQDRKQVLKYPKIMGFFLQIQDRLQESREPLIYTKRKIVVAECIIKVILHI